MSETPTLHFTAGLVGFPTAHRFALVAVGDPAGGLFRLVCLDAELEFVVAAPPVFFPDFAPEIDDETAARLGLADESSALTLVILTLADPLERSTANLLAPVVVNAATGQAAQVVLHGSDASLRRPLVAA